MNLMTYIKENINPSEYQLKKDYFWIFVWARILEIKHISLMSIDFFSRIAKKINFFLFFFYGFFFSFSTLHNKEKIINFIKTLSIMSISNIKKLMKW